MIGAGADSQISTAKEIVIAPHCAPVHWCCATADLNNRRLVYYDPFYDGPHRPGRSTRWVPTSTKFPPNMPRAEETFGAAAFESTVQKSPG